MSTKLAKEIADNTNKPCSTHNGNVTVFPESWTQDQIAAYTAEENHKIEEYNKWLRSGSWFSLDE